MYTYIDIVLIVMLLVAVIFDLKEQRIPNWLILAALLAALIGHVITGGLLGLLFSLKGFGVGLLLLIIPFMMGGMGAGDVKLLGVVGALQGSTFVLNAFVSMALWGGLMAVILLIGQRQLIKTIRRLLASAFLALFKMNKLQDSVEASNSGVHFPYALAIALGAISTYFITWW